MSGRALALWIVVLLASCAAKEPGQVALRFAWEDGAPGKALYASGQIRQGADSGEATWRVVASAGPLLYEPGAKLELPFAGVPHGDGLIVVVELRATASATDRVLYYGESKPFSFAPGDLVVVDVAVEMVAAPGVGSATGGVAIRGEPSVVARPTVDLVLWTDTGVSVQVSNFVDLREGATERLTLAKLPVPDEDVAEGARAYLLAGWDLERGVEPTCAESEDFCQRKVVAVFADEAGYPSAPYVTDVVLDRGAPELPADGIEMTPAVANVSSIVRVTLAFSEVLAQAPTLSVEGGAITFRAQPPGSAATYTFVAESAAGALGKSGAYALTATGAADLAGNEAGALPAGTLELDREAPEIGEIEVSVGGRPCPPEPEPCWVSAAALAGGESIELSVPVNEELRDGSPQARVGSLETEPCTLVEQWRYRCELPLGGIDTIDGDKPVTVRAENLAGNPSEAVGRALTFDTVVAPGSLDVSPDPASEGALLRVLYTATEILGTPPSLTVTDPKGKDASAGFAGPTEDGLAWRWTHTLNAQDPDDSWSFTVRGGADLAGNPDTGTTAASRVDQTPPSVRAFDISHTHARAGTPVKVTATASEDQDEAAGYPRLKLGGPPRAMTATGNAREYTATVTPGGGEGDGPKPVVVELLDGAGNFANEVVGSVTYDFTAPGIVEGSAEVQLFPADTNVLRSVEAVTAGTRVLVSFMVDEPLAKPPEVTATSPDDETPETLTFKPESSTGSRYAYEHTLEGLDHDQGEYKIELEARDRAGNPAPPASLELPVSFIVDTGGPGLPKVDEPGHIVYTRIPWGCESTTGREAYCLHGEALAVEPYGVVLVYDGPDTEEAWEIAHAAADDEGSFGSPSCADSEPSRFVLPSSAGEVLFIAVADRAGNVSPGAAAVRDVALTATMGRKIADSETENPHTVELRRWWGRRSWTDNPADVGASETLFSNDDSLLRVTARLGWERRAPGSRTAPTPRADLAMAYDAARQRVVLFGGEHVAGQGDCDGGDSRICSGTWEWDGASWTQRLPLTLEGQDGLSGKTRHAMVYDSRRERVVLFRHGTWEWDGASWVRRDPVDPEGDGDPAFRFRHAMAFDSVRDRVVLFGGAVSTTVGDCDGNGSRLCDATWEWDGASWARRLSAEAGDDTRPSRREGHAMAFDSARERVVLFGGIDGDRCKGPKFLCGDTWEWDGSGWSRRPPADPEGDGDPVPRYHHSMAFDSVRGRIVLFGGEIWSMTGKDDCDGGGDKYCVGTWEWDGTSWYRPSPEDPEGDGNPSPRADHATVFDSARGQVVLFGGVNRVSEDGCDAGGAPTCGATWLWDGTSWARPTHGDPDNDGEPAPSTEARMAFDADRQRVILLDHHDGALETWQWDGLSWSDLQVLGTGAGEHPTPHSQPAIAYDTKRKRLVLFGDELQSPGEACAGSAGRACAATWEWDGASWILARSTDPEKDGDPSPRSSAEMVYDASRARVVLFGGVDTQSSDGCDGAGTVLCAHTWEWNGASWQRRQPEDPENDGDPSPRVAHAMVYDSDRKRAVLFGGCDEDPPDSCFRDGSVEFRGDTWEWDGVSWARPLPADPERDGNPTSRLGHAMTYDERRGRTVLFGGMRQVRSGGSDSGHISFEEDAWSWDGTSWEKLYRTDWAGDRTPTARAGAALAYDTARGRMVLFGGIYDRTFHDETWESPEGTGPAASAAVMRVRLDAASTEDAELVAVTARLRAGGYAAVGLDETLGLRLMVYDRGTFMPATTATHHSDTPGPLTWTTRDPLQLARLPVGEKKEISFAVVSPDMPSAGREVRYRLPATVNQPTAPQ